MSDPSVTPTSFTGRSRRHATPWRVKASDSAARAIVTIGGIGTIAAVLLVFFFLLYVTVPLFFPARVTNVHRTETEATASLFSATDEFRNLSWRIDAAGKMTVIRNETGERVSELMLAEGKTISVIAAVPESTHILLGCTDGTAIPVAIDSESRILQDAEIEESIRDLPVGESKAIAAGLVTRTPQGLFRLLKVSAKPETPISLGDKRIISLDFLRKQGDESRATSWIIAAAFASGEPIVAEAEERKNILTDEVELDLNVRKLPLETARPPERIFLLGLGQTALAVWNDGLARRFELAGAQPRLAEETDFLPDSERTISAMMPLQGRSTLLVGDSGGGITAWFSALVWRGNREEAKFFAGHKLPPLTGSIVRFARSRKMRLAVAADDRGETALYHVTTEQKLFSARPFEGESTIDELIYGSNDDGLIIRSGTKSAQLEFEAGHPEATFSSLLLPVWYENYEHPRHMWQSSAGSDEPEPKFSVMPLVFGTFKATFYAMLIGAPLAILAAIYTSEFTDHAIRLRLKSLVELMAGLPSVVLGFLGGLVFAPFVEHVIPAILTALFTVPFALLLGAHVWQLIPTKTALRWSSLRLIGVTAMLPLGFFFAVQLSPWVERRLFDGNLKQWLSGSEGSGAAGWMLLSLPLCLVLTALALNTFVNPYLRNSAGSVRRIWFGLINLAKFLLAAVVAWCAADVLSRAALAILGDPRGRILDSYDQRNVIVVGFVMGFAVIPIIYTIAEDALASVPQHLRAASLGCGATPWQTTWRVVVPTAMSGLFSAIMVGLGRAVGETMIVLMGAGNTPNFDFNPFNGLRSLSANIAEELPETAAWSTHFRILFFTALLLLAITFVINTVAELVRISFRKRSGSL